MSGDLHFEAWWIRMTGDGAVWQDRPDYVVEVVAFVKALCLSTWRAAQERAKVDSSQPEEAP